MTAEAAARYAKAGRELHRSDDVWLRHDFIPYELVVVERDARRPMPYMLTAAAHEAFIRGA